MEKVGKIIIRQSSEFFQIKSNRYDSSTGKFETERFFEKTITNLGLTNLIEYKEILKDGK